MTDSRRRRDRRDDGVEGLAVPKTGFGLAPLRQVFGLEGPFLEMHVPEIVQVDLGAVGVQEVFDVGDGGFPRGVDMVVDVLFLLSAKKVLGKVECAAYGTAVSAENSVYQVYCKIMLVGSPFHRTVAVFLQRGDNGVHSPKNWRVRKDLFY